jgi:hypothetical protein
MENVISTGIRRSLLSLRCFVALLLAVCGLTVAAPALGQPEIRDLRIEPAELTLAPGEQATLRVYALYGDDTESLLSSGVVFELSDSDVARIEGFVLTALHGGDSRIRAEHPESGAHEEDPAIVTVLKVTSLAISPASVSLVAGRTTQLRALATLENGATGVDITEGVDWESRKRTVAKVSNLPGSKGLVSAMDSGRAEISIEDPESGEKSEKNSMFVDVTGSGGGDDGDDEDSDIDKLVVEPSSGGLLPGETIQLRVIAEYEDGSSADVTSECTFRSRRDKTAEVSSAGLVTAGESGSAKISIEHSSGISPRNAAEFWVGEVEQLTLEPKNPVLVVGDTLAMRVIATFDNGRSADLTQQVSWDSGKTRVASVGDSAGAKGRLTARTSGETLIVARDRESGAKTSKDEGSVIVVEEGQDPETIVPDPEKERSLRDIKNLIFDPAVLHLRPGESRTVRVTAVYDDGWTEDVSEHVELRSRNRRVVEVGDDTLVTALDGGDSEVRARYRDAGRKSRVGLEVQVSRLASLRITPAAIGLKPGESMQLRAMATYDDGSAEVDVTELVEWDSSRHSVAAVDNAAMKGLLTGLAEGKTDIQIEDPLSRTRSDRSNGRVEVGDDVDPSGPAGSADQIVGLAFDPPVLSLAVGGTAAFDVLGILGDGSRIPLDIGELRLNIASRRVASLEKEGEVFGRRGGSTELHTEHRASGTEAALPISVREIIRLEIDPADAAVRLGATLQLRALAEMNDGTTGLDVTDQVEWRSRDRSTVSVEDRGDPSPGLLTGIAAGTGQIEVRHGASRTTSDASTGNVIVVEHLERIYVEPTRVFADVGKDIQFQAFAIFADGSTVEVTKAVVWTVSDLTIATISADGSLTVRGAGETVVKATDLATGVSSTLSNGDASLSTSGEPGSGGGAPIRLQISTLPNEVLSSPANVVLTSGESTQLYALLSVEGEPYPFDRTDDSVWFSTNANAVPVENGRITCRESGSARISVALADGSLTSGGPLGDVDVDCTSADVVELLIRPDSVDVDYGDTKQLRAYRIYANGSELEVTRKVIWESERPAAVSVIESGEQGGKVTAHGDDIVKIIAYDADFDISSDDTNANSEIGVRKTRTRLEIFPIYPLADPDGIHRGYVGQLMIMKAKVWFKSGVTQGVNLKVIWTSSDPATILMGTGLTSSSAFKVNQGNMLRPGEVTLTAAWPADEFSSDLEAEIELEVLP